MTCEQILELWQESLWRLAISSLPLPQRGRVYAQVTSPFFLADAGGAATRDNPFAKRAGLSIIGIVAEKGRHPGNEAELRSAAVRLPVPDGRFGHSQLLGHLPLRQAQIKPAVPEVVTERVQLGRIG